MFKITKVHRYHGILSIIAGLIALLCIIALYSFRSGIISTTATRNSVTRADQPMYSAYTNQHTCIDPDHTSCDGLCECDGMECDLSELHDAIADICEKHAINARDYQIEIQDNGTKFVLYDKDKPVRVFDREYHANDNLFHVIDRDNY